MYRDYGSAVSYKHWHYSSTRSSTAYSNTVQYCTPGTCTIDSTSTLDVQVLHSTCRYSVLYQYHDSTIVIDSYYAVGIVIVHAVALHVRHCTTVRTVRIVESRTTSSTGTVPCAVHARIEYVQDLRSCVTGVTGDWLLYSTCTTHRVPLSAGQSRSCNLRLLQLQ